jgi:hypothetical protein
LKLEVETGTSTKKPLKLELENAVETGSPSNWKTCESHTARVYNQHRVGCWGSHQGVKEGKEGFGFVFPYCVRCLSHLTINGGISPVLEDPFPGGAENPAGREDKQGQKQLKVLALSTQVYNIFLWLQVLLRRDSHFGQMLSSGWEWRGWPHVQNSRHMLNLTSLWGSAGHRC